MIQTNAVYQLAEAGQSIWYDNIHRGLLGADLSTLIDQHGLRGITSNPAIFEKAITGSDLYDDTMRELVRANPQRTARELFFSLAIEDIQRAADQLLGVYESSHGIDGRVSLEVSPDLAEDSAGTITEARELHDRLDRPNVMIKVPATQAGLTAIEQLTADGISVNVTLLFSVDRYREVANAYMNGLERRLREDLPIRSIVSVASFFISRLDGLLDPELASKQPELAGKIAIANAKMAYQTYLSLIGSERWQRLAQQGANPQRLLWASSARKNPEYPETLYVDSLVGRDTVNTLPPALFDAVLARPAPKADAVLDGLEAARAQLAALDALGIDLVRVTERLEREGVDAFAESFNHLLAEIENRRETIVS